MFEQERSVPSVRDTWRERRRTRKRKGNRYGLRPNAKSNLACWTAGTDRNHALACKGRSWARPRVFRRVLLVASRLEPWSQGRLARFRLPSWTRKAGTLLRPAETGSSFRANGTMRDKQLPPNFLGKGADRARRDRLPLASRCLIKCRAGAAAPLVASESGHRA